MFLLNNESELLFQQVKTTFTKDIILTLPNKNHPFSITVGSYVNRMGCVLFQKKFIGNWISLQLNLDILSLLSKNCVLYIVN